MDGLYSYFNDFTSYQSVSKSKIFCPVCLDTFNIGETITSKCKHSVCVNCCSKMVNNLCPLCRVKMTGTSKWGYWGDCWISLEYIMLKDIKLAKKRLKKEKKYKEKNFKLAKYRSLIANF